MKKNTDQWFGDIVIVSLILFNDIRDDKIGGLT